MKYLKIKDWDRWQTFRKDRGTPPWIKVYRNLFSNPEWMELTDQEKGQLVSMWIAAADKSGKIPINPKIVQKTCFLDEPPDLQRFKDLGFIDGNVTTEGDNQLVTTDPILDNHLPTINGKLDAPETETETETETEAEVEKPIEHPEPDAPNSRNNFEWLWNEYPEKKGKEKAWFKFKAQIKSPDDYENICVALANYKNDVKRIRLNGQPDLYWQHGSTWFNQNWKDYVNYEPPKVMGDGEKYDGIPKDEPLPHNELSEKIKEQIEFAEEMLNDDTYQGGALDHDWLNRSVGNRILEYSERFPKGPFMERFTEQFGILSNRVMNMEAGE